jgi:protein gp37
MGDTKIEWCDKVWNPIRGCSRVSRGCEHCYAETAAARFSGPGMPYEGLAYRNDSGAHWTGKVRLIEEHVNDPLRWRKPAMIFVNSMSDLFHESLSDGAILRVFDVMRQCPQHTFQILTKRPARMLDWFKRWANTEGEPREPQLVRGPKEQRKAHPSPRGQMFAEYLETLGTTPPPGCAWPTFDWIGGMRWWPASTFTLPNVWLGVSVEDQKTADERIPLLMETLAAVRWISAEPLLGLIDLESVPTMEGSIDWVVCGGESGPKARPIHPDWARSLRDQCVAADVPFFFKQWGQLEPVGIVRDGDEVINGTAVYDQEGERILPDCCSNDYEVDPEQVAVRFKSVGKKAAGRLLDGREWNEYPKARAVAAEV